MDVFSHRPNMECHGIIRLRVFGDLEIFKIRLKTNILAWLTITYFKWTDHLGLNPDTTFLVLNRDGKIGAIREGSKGPVRPAVKDVLRVHPNSLSFESSGSHLGTVSFLNLEEGSLLESGVDDLEILLVNLKNSAEVGLLTTETKPLKPGLSATVLLAMTTRLGTVELKVGSSW